MIGLDTTVLVRFIAQDDEGQAETASALIDTLNQTNPGFITMLVVIELCWVLTACYASTKDDLIQVLERLLHNKQFVVERSDIVAQALRRFASSNAQFSDCLIERCGKAEGCEETVTFDQGAAEYAGMRLLK